MVAVVVAAVVAVVVAAVVAVVVALVVAAVVVVALVALVAVAAVINVCRIPEWPVVNRDRVTLGSLGWSLTLHLGSHCFSLRSWALSALCTAQTSPFQYITSACTREG